MRDMRAIEVIERLREVATISAMTPEEIGKVRALEAANLDRPQMQMHTQHVLHAGAYARTIKLEKGTIITGALIKRATMLIVSGHALVHVGNHAEELMGYHLIAASSNRKQAFVALDETWLTMIFASEAKSVVQAENEFTDEPELLMSRQTGNSNHVIITGE